ncbi:MAG: hypothetical protein GX958_12670 [Desulfitobacterium sp.]|nr:hypothetical protein [Desulfitobacterium sp.]
MEFLVSLKKECELLNEKDAKQRYLELLAMGYKDHEILLAAPVPVEVHLKIGNQGHYPNFVAQGGEQDYTMAVQNQEPIESQWDKSTTSNVNDLPLVDNVGPD